MVTPGRQKSLWQPVYLAHALPLPLHSCHSLQLSAWLPGLWMAARLEVTLFWYRPHCFCCIKLFYMYSANQVHLHDKSKKICIKARSPPASLPFKGQVTEQTTVKWSITFPHCHSFTFIQLKTSNFKSFWLFNRGVKRNKITYGATWNWPWPLNRSGCWIEVFITVYSWQFFPDSGCWLPNKGLLLNRGWLNRGLTVVCFVGYVTMYLLHIIWVIDQVWGQDGWILAKFFFWVFIDGDRVEVHKLTKKERGKAILTEQTWSIKDLFYGLQGNFSCGTW